MVDAYVNRKHGREKPVYPHPVMEEILGETHGVHGLPGTGHAHPQPPGRHRAVQRLCLHQGDQQEEARDHRPAPGGFHQGRPGTRPERGDGAGNLRADRLLRRLRLQQVAQCRLRPGRLPDRLSEGPLHARVHGRPAVQRDRGRQQARHHGRAHRRRPPAGRRGAAADVNASEVGFTVRTARSSSA